MRRDFSLIRRLLQDLEAERPINEIADVTTREHLRIMTEGGLVRRNTTSIVTLTWEGHEFLALARHDKAWDEAMARLATQGDLPYELLTTLLQALLRDRLDRSAAIHEADRVRRNMRLHGFSETAISDKLRELHLSPLVGEA